MDTPQRPSLLDKALSTPPITPGSSSNMNPKVHHGVLTGSFLTPPTSPRQSRSSSNISKFSTATSALCIPPPPPLSILLKEAKLDAIETNIAPQSAPTETCAFECPFDVEILKDKRGRPAVFGAGAWSTVYQATTMARSITTSVSLTPPLSPAVVPPALVAVKTPARRDAVEILKSEAKILSHLRRLPENEKYVVPFYGLVDEATIVMEAIPFTLENHIRNCALTAKLNFSTSTMTDPVLGSTAKWLHLAQRLISALAWLHDEAQVVHGDIKPSNILLSQVRGSGPDISFEPVFADFSSSQRLDLEETTPNTLSALTREYTAPELLSSKVLRDPTSRATSASDVFSMALTLLVAATAQLLVYPGSVYQRQAMATQGWLVLSHARNGDGGTRLPTFGTVERVLEEAVLKVDMGRISAQEWSSVIETIAKGEPAKI